jgi:hypothetical protein
MAELRPLEADAMLSQEELNEFAGQMWAHADDMSDEDADTLDAVAAIWIDRIGGPDDDVLIELDEVLRMRHIKPKLGGGGRRGGFEREQRAAIYRCLLRARHVLLTMEFDVYEGGRHHSGKKKMPMAREAVRSQALHVIDPMGQMKFDGTMDVQRVYVRFGRVFARFLTSDIGRQTLWLSSKALAYNPRTHAPEKRLIRHVSSLWRIRSNHRDGYLQPFRIHSLLKVTGILVDEGTPRRTLERFEAMLDRLQGDGLIANWAYTQRRDPATLPRKGWVPTWLSWSVTIEPPDAIRDHYPARQWKATRASLPAPRSQKAESIGERLKTWRQAQKLSQARAAEMLEISQPTYSRAEQGASVSPGLRKRVESLLARGGTALS